jgi:hypothetical protein
MHLYLHPETHTIALACVAIVPTYSLSAIIGCKHWFLAFNLGLGDEVMVLVVKIPKDYLKLQESFESVSNSMRI